MSSAEVTAADVRATPLSDSRLVPAGFQVETACRRLTSATPRVQINTQRRLPPRLVYV